MQIQGETISRGSIQSLTSVQAPIFDQRFDDGGRKGLSFNRFTNHFRASIRIGNLGTILDKGMTIRTFHLSIVTSFFGNEACNTSCSKKF